MAAAAKQPSLPHTLTNGHSKGHFHGDDTSSSSQADEDSSSDSLAADAAAVDDARVQTQEAAMSGVGVGSAGVIGGVGQDVFDEDEADPAKCRAIESSLWELESLRHHYYHAVSYIPACVFPLLYVTTPSYAYPCLCTRGAKLTWRVFLISLATVLQGSETLAVYLRS